MATRLRPRMRDFLVFHLHGENIAFWNWVAKILLEFLLSKTLANGYNKTSKKISFTRVRLTFSELFDVYV